MADAPAEHIVVVDDDTALLALLKRQLQRAGFEVHAFDSGPPALEIVPGLGSCLVVADWNMPGMDGLQLCRAVRELEAMQAIHQVYFILLTAHDRKEQIIEGLAAGANDYLTKPYHEGELLARVRVGERMVRLSRELLQRTIELHKANAQMAVLANRLEQQARSDILTGLPNRRCLFERFHEQWELSTRSGLPLSCLVIDVDCFKRVNDTYGHATGDLVLRNLAEVMRRCSRRPDLCARYGGEEFAIICPATDLAGASQLAERLRAAVELESTAWNLGPPRITISCGVAERRTDVPGPDELLRLADAMLYEAKSHGRNQVWRCVGPGVGERVPPETALSTS